MEETKECATNLWAELDTIEKIAARKGDFHSGHKELLDQIVEHIAFLKKNYAPKEELKSNCPLCAIAAGYEIAAMNDRAYCGRHRNAMFGVSQ